jgi:Tol biopolymer transport system component
VKIATEVADALHYAHTQGVIHRDIKPENILIQNGRPMVADFGIALAVSAAAGGRMTETGLSLGTPHYMSPEQATAEKEITGRSDIYSLASVLYEMLTGQPPHLGGSAQQIIMKIIAETPRPLTELRKSAPPHVAAAVAQALEKLPADRFATASDFIAALQGRITARSAAPRAGTLEPTTALWKRIAVGAAAVAFIFAALFLWGLAGRSSTNLDDGVTVFTFRPVGGLSIRPSIAISPDGRRVAVVSLDSNGVSRLAVREFGSLTTVPIAGTEGAEDVAFSRDGAWIAFTGDSKLRKVPASGGTPVVLADSLNGGGSWTSDGKILYMRSSRGLWRVPESGGAVEEVTKLDPARREFAHWYPQELPGGKAVIYNSFTTPFEKSRIEAFEYATGRIIPLIDGALHPRYIDGTLLYWRDGAIFAAPFDPDKLRVLGPSVPVVEDVAGIVTDGQAGFSVSPNGTLAYLKGSEFTIDRRVVWVDRSGNERPALTDAGSWAEPRLSPDGRWIALSRMKPSTQIWLFDRGRQVLTQLTKSAGVSFNAVWMPNSLSLVHVTETPVYDLHRTPIDGTAADTVVVSAFDKQPTSVSPDGKTVAYMETMDRDRLVLLSTGGTPVIERGEQSLRNGAISPDGRWLAFEEFGTDQTPQVYVRQLAGGGRRQVSAGGGSQPRWTRNGRELVFRKGPTVFAVSFDPKSGDVGTPVFLFSRPDAGRLNGNRTVGYDVTPDGSQFLMVTPVNRPEAQPVVVIVNWVAELRKKVRR